MWTNSILRPVEEAKAKRFFSRNNRVLVRRTPAKLKAELTSRAKAKIGELYTKTKELETELEPVANELKEYRHLGNKLGTKGITAAAIINALNNRAKNSADFDSSLKSLDPGIGEKYRAAHQLAKSGKIRAAKSELIKARSDVNAVTHAGLEKHILGGSDKVQDIVGNRSNKLNLHVGKLEQHLGKLQNDLKSAATVEDKERIRSLISKTNSKVRELRTRAGIYKGDITKEAISKAERTYKKLNAEILSNIKQGIGMKEALNNALAEIDATPEQKLQLKQQILDDFTNGTPMKSATQRAAEKVMEEPTENPEYADDGKIKGSKTPGMLTGSKALKEIIEAL
jgi:hypothetical protein